MGTFMNFLTSTLGQDILGLLVIGLTGGSGAAIVAAKKLVTANNINKGIVTAVDAFRDPTTPYTDEVLDEEIKKHVPYSDLNSLNDLKRKK